MYINNIFYFKTHLYHKINEDILFFREKTEKGKVKLV